MLCSKENEFKIKPNQLKSEISTILENIKTIGLLDNDLYQEIQRFLSNINQEELDLDRMEIIKTCALLEKLSQHCDTKRREQSLNEIELAQRSSCLLKSLRKSEKDGSHCSIHEVLIRVELLFFDLLDDNGKLDERTGSSDKLVEIYTITNDPNQSQKSMMVDDQKAMENDRLYLLNELMDAPLEDINLYFQSAGWSFDQFYTNEIFGNLLHRLEYSKFSLNSDDSIIDQVSTYIKQALTRKYCLNRRDLASLLHDQFYIITPTRYRIHLEKYVNHRNTGRFTLADFYSFSDLGSILAPDDDKFTNLFKIYCKKLRDGKKAHTVSKVAQPVIDSHLSAEAHSKCTDELYPKVTQKQQEHKNTLNNQYKHKTRQYPMRILELVQ